MKRTKKRKWSVRALAAMLIAILAMPTVGLKTHAEELTDSNIPNVNVTNKEVEYNSTVQPLTTMVDCEITMAFTLNGLEMTFTNLSVEASEKVEIQLANRGYHVTEAKIVTDSDMHAHNTFEAPDTVTEKDFTAYEETENGVNVTMPANSVIELRLAK